MDWPKSLKEEFAFWQAMIAANSSGSIRMWQTGSSGDSSHGSAKALEIWRNPWRCTSATPKNQERENMLGVSSYLQCLRLDFHCRTRKPTAQALNQTGLSQNVKLRLAYRLAFVTNINTVPRERGPGQAPALLSRDADWGSHAATLHGAVTLRRCMAGATLRRCLALRRCDAGWRRDAATLLGASTLRRWMAARRCDAAWRFYAVTLNGLCDAGALSGRLDFSRFLGSV